MTQAEPFGQSRIADFNGCNYKERGGTLSTIAGFDMNPWLAPFLIALAGFVGGAMKTFVTGTGDIELPSTNAGPNGVKIVRPGWFSNLGVGAIAALVSWALYGAGAGKEIFSTVPNDLTWSGWGAAVLVGIAGSGWLSAEVDKTVFRKTAVIAAQKAANPALSATISAASPDQALKAAYAAAP